MVAKCSIRLSRQLPAAVGTGGQGPGFLPPPPRAMGSTVPAGVATPGTTAPDSAAVGAPTKQAPATGAATTGEAVMAAETLGARGRPGWLLPVVAGLAVVGLPSWCNKSSITIP